MMSRVFPSALAAMAVIAAAPFAHAQSPDLTALHDALHLTAVQEEAWRAYRAQSAPDPQVEARHRAAQAMMASLTTPRRIDLVAAEMASDLELMRQQGEAVKAFYSRLTPDQQRIFDRQTLQAGQRGGDGRVQDRGPSAPGLRQPPSGQPMPQPGQP